MMLKTKLSRAIALSLIGGSVVLPATFANAQEDNEKIEKSERIEVTGSRIARPELSNPTPVLTVDAKAIAQFGTPDLGEILAELPAIGATDTLIGNNGSNTFAGQSFADLRRLESSRTLVLVNGKRHVAGAQGSAQVDLSTIPSSLIERVEIITGGASAIYGSDAVSGVINVILKKDFEGLEFRMSGASSTEGVGARNNTFSILGGADLSNGKGNVTFFASREYLQETMANDLRQSDDWGTIVNPEDGGEDDGIPDRIRVPRVMSERIDENGVLNPYGFEGNTGTLWVFDNAGNPLQQTERAGTNSFAFGQFPDGCDYCFELNDYENFQPGVERFTVGSTLNYDINENITFYSDVKYVQADIKQQFQPSFRFGNVFINVQDNAFLSNDFKQTLLNEGHSTIRMAKFFAELGNRSAANDRSTFRYVGGFKGGFSLGETDFNYDTYYVYGETKNTRVTQNDLIVGNLVAALDSVIDPTTGEAACRSQVASAQGEGYTDPATVNGDNCVAYNPFGFNQASDAAKDWVSANTTRSDKITQEMIGGSLTFDTGAFFSLPGGAISFAMGFEYREETSKTITDEFTKRDFLTGAATPDEYGEYDVTESFIEVSLPILAEVPFAHELTMDAAFRTADYSHAGTVDAWKVGLMYAPIKDVRIRGTISEAVRAPNISEAFSPQSPGFANINDPCDADNIGDDPDRASNCAALGIPAGFQANDNVSIDTLSGGNPDLTPEESESLTAGVVWTPTFFEGFSLTLDYYDIEIKDAIIQVASQDILDNCVDATGGPDLNYCSQIDRDPVTNDIELVRSGYLNAAAYNTKGVELQARYKTDLSMFDLAGEMTFNLVGNKLLELERFEFQDRPDEINVEKGEIGDPEYQFRFSAEYQLEDLSVMWLSRFSDRQALFDVSPGADTPEDTSPAFIGSIVTHDLSASYMFNDNIVVGLGIRNLFDRLPPAFITSGGDGNESIYDVVGRRIYGNVRVSF
ncbi:TonB-dependent receptor [Paraneptunicella aestuarii]|uniref:TonB-dependent receptor domain-containing protein n=1 Tax=Paraneptunicella aestuarii TaxID=2831148 RepID=UPI001E3FB0E9|nr:TonB-dependent receptor [Paraneptunicella aestuarii]UAA39264.1 TonB-dependent receptor [Paraneptunicella aestuarii]